MVRVGAFAAPQLGQFGSSAKGVIIAPPLKVWRSSIAKEFFSREGIRLRLEGLATNLANHPNYNVPNMSITTGVNAGLVTSVVNRNRKFDSAVPREMQAPLRVEW